MRLKTLVFALLLLMATYLPAFVLVSVLVMTVPDFASAVDTDPWLVVPVIIATTLTTSTLLILRISRGNLRGYGLHLPDRDRLWRPLVTGLIFGTLIGALGRLFGGDSSSFLGETPLVWGILLFWVGAPIQEETIFRGLFQGYLSLNLGGNMRAGPLPISVPALISAIAFSAVHVGIFTTGSGIDVIAPTVLGALVLGILAGHYRARDGSLLGPIIIHALFNATGTLIAM